MHRKASSIKFAVIISFLLFSFISAWAQSENKLISPKIGPLLHQTIKKQESSSATELEKVIVVINREHLKPLPDEIIVELKTRVEELGGYIGNHAYNNVQVWIPLDKIAILAEWSDIKMINSPLKPSANSIASEAGSVIGSYQWHPYGLTGKGIKVGIIDLGFRGYESLLGVELPSYVTTKIMGDYSDFTSSIHGTACAEIIHDIVPEAELFLVNAGDYNVDFHNAVLWLQSQGVHVISSSIGLNLKIYNRLIYEVLTYQNGDYLNSQLAFIDQLKAQWNTTINNAVSQGIPWSQAAGNDGQKKWEGMFNDPENDFFLNFSPTMNFNEINFSQFQYGEEVYVNLFWGLDSGLMTSDDYDFAILDEYGTVVGKSEIRQILLPVGMEAIKFTPVPGRRYFIFVLRYWATIQKMFISVGSEQFPNLNYFSPERTVNMNSPAYNANVITVGAISYNYPFTVRAYSSQGPTGDGVIKPDLVAPDCVSTASYQSSFCGTSAAAPHVSGLIAQLKQAYPSWGPPQIKSFLESWAYDLGTAGKDNAYGSGGVQLPLPIFADVILGHWAFFNTLGIYYTGITTGCSQNPLMYCPDNYVTREQMAVFITKSLKQAPPDGYCGGMNPFSDVSYDRWSCKYIKKFMELGITSGYGDGRFGPNDSVTREQMAVFITRALAAVPADGYCGFSNPFTDVSYDRWSCKYVKKFAEMGITTGYGDGRYGPGDYVTRAQMAVFLSRAFLGM